MRVRNTQNQFAEFTEKKLLYPRLAQYCKVTTFTQHNALAWNSKAGPCNFICLSEFDDTLKTNLKSSRRRQCQSASRPALWAIRAWS